ncbi:MAG: DUF3054 domain-containing protein [Anaerolineales bacterium]|nr:DUF3054 domain-containing protein [Anaerolineales bacterium]
MNKKTILVIGDIISLVLLTIIGFATHGETGASFIPRMGTTFLPMLFSWFMLTPWFGLFDEQVVEDPKNLWRIIPAMLFIAPLAATLRAAWLGAAMLPLFPLILGGSNALGMMVWRWIYVFIAMRFAK